MPSFLKQETCSYARLMIWCKLAVSASSGLILKHIYCFLYFTHVITPNVFEFKFQLMLSILVRLINCNTNDIKQQKQHYLTESDCFMVFLQFDGFSCQFQLLFTSTSIHSENYLNSNNKQMHTNNRASLQKIIKPNELRLGFNCTTKISQ